MEVGLFRFGDFLALVVLPGDMRYIESAVRGVTGTAKCIRWLGEGRGLRVAMPRGELPRLGDARERG